MAQTFSRRIFLASGASSLYGQNTSSQSTRRPPNIVLIIADDLGYGDLGCYGNTKIRTPNIDSLARDSVRFTNFYVTWPACTPSRGSILTGRYPQRNGLYEMIRNNEVNWKYEFDEYTYSVSPEMTLGLDTREVTIGQAMRDAGYRTGLIGKWDSGRAKRFLPRQRGFDYFYGFANTGVDYYTHARYGVPSLFRNNERITEEGHLTDLFKREAIKFIDDNRGRPFFLYFAPNAPHIASTFDKEAHQVPDKYLEMYGVKKYDRKGEYPGLVTQLDDAVGEILAKLDDNTLVVFISDNGGDNVNNNGGLRGKKTDLFEGGIRVPMIARWPGHIPAGKVRDEIATTLEFFPTFLAAAGRRPPANLKLDGYNLLPTLQGGSPSPRKDCFWQREEDRAARVGDWKWVQSRKGSGLFNLAVDRNETKDLSTEKPDVLAMMKSRWDTWRKDMDASEPRGPFRDY